MSGHDKREGGVTGVGLQRLAEEVTLAPNLQVLELLNQIMQEDKRNLFEEFTRSRPRLKLYEGDMLGEGVTSVSPIIFKKAFVKYLTSIRTFSLLCKVVLRYPHGWEAIW